MEQVCDKYTSTDDKYTSTDDKYTSTDDKYIDMDIHIDTECGFVKLIDVMPGLYRSEVLRCDEAIVQSARVSYNQTSKGDEQDSKLVRFLIMHNHGTPLESVIFKFHIRCPIFVQRHIVKHRISTMNEISARYTEVRDEWYVPKTFRVQSKNNRQASGGDMESHELIDDYNATCGMIYGKYKEMLDKGVCREMARMILPQSMMTEFYLTINLRSLFNLCLLRNSGDAQFETQEVAKALESIIAQTNPVSYETFRKNNPIK